MSSQLYSICLQEADKNKNGTADHSMWRNYDDLNEFFWSEHLPYYVSLLPYLCLKAVNNITNQFLTSSTGLSNASK